MMMMTILESCLQKSAAWRILLLGGGPCGLDSPHDWANYLAQHVYGLWHCGEEPFKNGAGKLTFLYLCNVASLLILQLASKLGKSSQLYCNRQMYATKTIYSSKYWSDDQTISKNGPPTIR